MLPDGERIPVTTTLTLGRAADNAVQLRDPSVSRHHARLSLRPNSDLTSTNQFGFSEYRIVGTYREPKAFGGSGDLTATAAVEQGVRTGFNFSRKGFNGELAHRLTPTIRGWFAESGFAEVAMDVPEDTTYRVGAHRLVAATQPLAPGRTFFTFTR